MMVADDPNHLVALGVNTVKDLVFATLDQDASFASKIERVGSHDTLTVRYTITFGVTHELAKKLLKEWLTEKLIRLR